MTVGDDDGEGRGCVRSVHAQPHTHSPPWTLCVNVCRMPACLPVLHACVCVLARGYWSCHFRLGPDVPVKSDPLPTTPQSLTGGGILSPWQPWPHCQNSHNEKKREMGGERRSDEGGGVGRWGGGGAAVEVERVCLNVCVCV